MTRQTDGATPPATFVTGAAGGIGLATARLLATRGRPVALLDRDGDACSREADQLRAGGANAVAIAVDIGDEAEVAAAFAEATERLGPPRGLVASAGIDRGGVAHELELETFDEVVRVNLRGTLLACRAALATMVHTGGSIVVVSSPFAFVAAPAITAYGASKAGASALVRSLAVDYAARGVRVNAVLPGPTETGLMWASVAPADVAAMREVIAGEVPLARLADPQEPAYAIAWLLSDEASFVTGAQLACDGGLLAKAAISV